MIVSAAIFDLNGTVVADERNYGLAFRKVLESLGAKVYTDYPHEAGIGVTENWPNLLVKYNVKTRKSPSELAKETQDEYLRNVSRVKLEIGFTEFVKELRESGIQLALATSNSWSILDSLDQKLGISKYFDVITTGEEVVYKKPDPEIFQITANKLGVEPMECLVFEDAQSGIKAAHFAGMKAVGVLGEKADKNSLDEADLVINDFSEITPETLSEI